MCGFALIAIQRINGGRFKKVPDHESFWATGCQIKEVGLWSSFLYVNIFLAVELKKTNKLINKIISSG